MKRNVSISDRVVQIPEYVFSVLGRAVAKVERETGKKVLNLGPGSPDIPPSELYREKLCEYMREPGAHLYPGYRAIPELANALIAWYRKRFDVEIEAENILPLLGAKDGVSHLPLALLNPGDEILVPDPGYPAYGAPAIFAGATPVPYALSEENNFTLSVAELEKRITKKTKGVWVNFPSNPTGRVMTKEELEPIVDFCVSHGMALLYDNAYAEITFGERRAPSILQIPRARDIAVELGSFSKTFSFAGFRMGWIAGNPDIVQALTVVKSQMDSGLSVPLQKLGAFALDHFDEKWFASTLASYRNRRDRIAEKLRSLGLVFDLPEGGLYIWAKIPDGEKDSLTFCDRILHERQVLLVPGSAFGKNGDRFVRASICSNIDSIDRYL